MSETTTKRGGRPSPYAGKSYTILKKVKEIPAIKSADIATALAMIVGNKKKAPKVSDVFGLEIPGSEGKKISTAHFKRAIAEGVISLVEA